MVACQSGQEAIARLLLENDAQVNDVNLLGETALMLACHFGTLEVAHFLLERDAYVNQIDEDGYTALDYASRRSDFETIVHILVEKGAIRCQ